MFLIKVQIPDNNIPEREYILKTILTDFLGIPLSISVSASLEHYSLVFNESEIVIHDNFFCHYPYDLSYLSLTALPSKISFVRNEFVPENDIPVIYGTDKMEIEEKRIICGIDIFASSFFLLTRWEEFVNKIRDKHDRFPGKESTAEKEKFLNRPLVNEYVEMLWNMLVKAGYRGKRRERNFELCLTHDVDALRSGGPYIKIFRDIIKRRNIRLLLEHLQNGFLGDPSFVFLMRNSEKLGIKSHFYFMSSDTKLDYDTTYYLQRRVFNSVIREIKKRGHIIGFHPGYYTYSDIEKWTSERQQLEDIIQQEVFEGRQHFLRMDVTKTLPIWSANNMMIDSTLGYADNEGFRCGTGDEFHVFDFLNRKQLELKERPLIIMDGTLWKYQNYSLEQSSDIVRHYISIGKKFKTKITLLFHTAIFFEGLAPYDIFYKEVLNI